MKRIAVRKFGKTAVMMGRVPHEAHCAEWRDKVRRASVLMLTHRRLRKVA
jgi:hypothetical protein